MGSGNVRVFRWCYRLTPGWSQEDTGASLWWLKCSTAGVTHKPIGECRGGAETQTSESRAGVAPRFFGKLGVGNPAQEASFRGSRRCESLQSRAKGDHLCIIIVDRRAPCAANTTLQCHDSCDPAYAPSRSSSLESATAVQAVRSTRRQLCRREACYPQRRNTDAAIHAPGTNRVPAWPNRPGRPHQQRHDAPIAVRRRASASPSREAGSQHGAHRAPSGRPLHEAFRACWRAVPSQSPEFPVVIEAICPGRTALGTGECRPGGWAISSISARRAPAYAGAPSAAYWGMAV